MTVNERDANREKPGYLRRAGRAVLRTTTTLAVAGLAIVAVALGSQELTRRAEAVPAPDPAHILPVAITPVAMLSGYEVTRSFVGQVEAQRRAVVSFELSGKLKEILVDEGDTVVLGQHIATLDTRLLDAERDRLEASKLALQAQLRFAQQTVERRTALTGQGIASQSALDEALSRSEELQARIAETEAALMTNAIQAEKTKIHAPFGGRLTERFVDGGESISPGQGLVEIVETGTPQLRVGLPLDVTPDDLATANVEIDNRRYDVALVALRPDVDPVTRTRTAIFELESDASVAFGQTGRLLLSETIPSEGLWVPLTTLKEGLRGQWTLLVVDANDLVRAVTVQVLHTQKDRVFVNGAFPDGVRLIASGPQRVTVGQTVDPQPAT